MSQGCNSFFGQDNCIEVIPYLPEAIEYQYPGEPLHTIYSNGGELNYELKEIYPDNTRVFVFGRYMNKSNECNQVGYFRSFRTIKNSVNNSLNDLNNTVQRENNENQARLDGLTFQYINRNMTCNYFSGSAFNGNKLNSNRPVSRLKDRSLTNYVSFTLWCKNNFISKNIGRNLILKKLLIAQRLYGQWNDANYRVYKDSQDNVYPVAPIEEYIFNPCQRSGRELLSNFAF